MGYGIVVIFEVVKKVLWVCFVMFVVVFGVCLFMDFIYEV